MSEGISNKRLEEAREMRDAPGACKNCWGSGKVTDGDDPEPWPMWDALEGMSRLSITMGLVRPVTCSECGGTGKVGSKQNA